MEITLTRIARKKGYTIGRLTMNGHRICDTLEPQWRDFAHGAQKVRGRSAIPEGRYPLVVTLSKRFGRWLPLVVGVPNFTAIRIHAGNTAADTRGCILPGDNLTPGRVDNSQEALARVMNLLKRRPLGEAAWLIVK